MPTDELLNNYLVRSVWQHTDLSEQMFEYMCELLYCILWAR